MKKTLKDATAELKAAAAIEDDTELTQDQIEAYRNILDTQRMEADLTNQNTFLALDVIRTLEGLISANASNIHDQEDGTITALKKVAAAKITEAIGQIKFNGDTNGKED